MKTPSRKKIVTILNRPSVQAIIYSRFLDYHQWALLSFVKAQARSIPSSKNILDVGAGELKYKEYFAHCKYVSNDLGVGSSQWYFDQIDIKSTIYKIPVETASYDYVLCTQVLEHLEFPELAYEEMSRILKPGGKLIVTVPLGQGEHQTPHDFYRYTQYALRGLGKRHGLRMTFIQPQGGIFINLEYMLWQTIGLFIPLSVSPLIRYPVFLILTPLKFVSGIIFIMLDVLDRKKTYTLNYNCVYKKITTS